MKNTNKNLVIKNIEKSIRTRIEIKKELKLCCFINLSNNDNYIWFGKKIGSICGINLLDYYSYTDITSESYESHIEIYDKLPYTFMHLTIPLIYLVSNFSQLKGNSVWREVRDTSRDLVVDELGHIVYLSEISENV